MNTKNFKVGDKVTIVRYRCNGSVDHQHESTIVKMTPKRAYLDERTYIDLASGIVRPAYLDYVTRVSG